MTDHHPTESIDSPNPRATDSIESQIRCELRAAREYLAHLEASEPQGGPITLSPEYTTPMRLWGLTESQLEDHIDRLERDLADIKAGEFTTSTDS
jgi:hypothetical protein